MERPKGPVGVSAPMKPHLHVQLLLQQPLRRLDEHVEALAVLDAAEVEDARPARPLAARGLRRRDSGGLGEEGVGDDRARLLKPQPPRHALQQRVRGGQDDVRLPEGHLLLVLLGGDVHVERHQAVELLVLLARHVEPHGEHRGAKLPERPLGPQGEGSFARELRELDEIERVPGVEGEQRLMDAHGVLHGGVAARSRRARSRRTPPGGPAPRDTAHPPARCPDGGR